MSNETPALVMDAAIEHRLVTALRAVGARVLERPELLRAAAAADSIGPGVVIGSEEHAVELADAMRVVLDGEKALAFAEAEALRIPRQMEAAVRGVLAPLRSKLASAKAAGNDARVNWQAELRRRAAAEQAEREAHEKAAAEAAAAAAAAGEDVPPPLDIPEPEVPRLVRAGSATTGTQVRVQAVEVVDWDKVPKAWLDLNAMRARTAFAGERIPKPAPGDSVVWKGVRFEAVETAVNR